MEISAPEYGKYHPDCANRKFNPSCTLCGQIIQGTYRKHSYYEDEVYCMNHVFESDLSPSSPYSSTPPIPSCFACTRKQPLSSYRPDLQFMTLPDGRSLCVHCNSSAVIDSKQMFELLKELIRLLEQRLNISFRGIALDFPVLSVDVLTLNDTLRQQQEEAYNFYNNQAQNGQPPSHPPGCCCFSHSLNGDYCFESNSRRNRNSAAANAAAANAAAASGQPAKFNLSAPEALTYGLTLTTIKKSIRYYEIGLQQNYFNTKYDTTRVTSENKKIQSILILSGLPLILFNSVLAHEIMHVYFKMNPKFYDIRLPNQTEEGLCQLISYLYLRELKINYDVKLKEAESRGKGVSNNGFFRERVFVQDCEQYINRIMGDTSIIYGQGFQKAYAAYNKFGLDQLLELVSIYHDLPPQDL